MMEVTFGWPLFFCGSETARQRDRETERQRDKETERQRDRETQRGRVSRDSFCPRESLCPPGRYVPLSQKYCPRGCYVPLSHCPKNIVRLIAMSHCLIVPLSQKYRPRGPIVSKILSAWSLCLILPSLQTIRAAYMRQPYRYRRWDMLPDDNALLKWHVHGILLSDTEGIVP